MKKYKHIWIYSSFVNVSDNKVKRICKLCGKKMTVNKNCMYGEEFYADVVKRFKKIKE